MSLLETLAVVPLRIGQAKESLFQEWAIVTSAAASDEA